MATHTNKTLAEMNDENAFPRNFNAKSAVPSQAPATRRTALSAINDNVVEKPKVVGAIKPGLKVSQPAYLSQKQLKPSFAIFEDAENENLPARTAESDSLPATVTQLFKYPDGPKLTATPGNENSYLGSPMVLDTSCTFSNTENDELYNSAVYDEEIFSYLKSLELKFRPKPTYIRKQPDITISMRAVLVDWLVDVVESYKMRTATLYLSVSFTDRFLSQMSVLRSKLQLVGTSSLFIASKFEEIYPPELKEFVYVTDDTYTKKQVLRMEHLILKVLAFDLAAPTAYDFMQRFFTKCATPEKTRHLAEYICELSLLDAEPFLSFLPSVTAASSLYLANLATESDPWGPVHIAETGYTAENLEACIKCLHNRHSTISETSYRASTEKYKSYQYNCVSDIKLPPFPIEDKC